MDKMIESEARYIPTHEGLTDGSSYWIVSKKTLLDFVDPYLGLRLKPESEGLYSAKQYSLTDEIGVKEFTWRLDNAIELIRRGLQALDLFTGSDQT
jgi:hypothetical protein